MGPIRSTCAAVLVGALVLVPGRPVAASEGSEATCAASGYWEGAEIEVVVGETGDEVVTIPRNDTVNWEGSVDGPPGDYRGSIWLELPAPLPAIEIDSWSGDSTNTTNSGVHEYDLPKLVPAGMEFVVAGEHVDANGLCTGQVRLVIDGGAFESPVTYVAIALTLLTGGPLAVMLLGMIKAMLASSVRSL